jgi:hypothetical protein
MQLLIRWHLSFLVMQGQILAYRNEVVIQMQQAVAEATPTHSRLALHPQHFQGMQLTLPLSMLI